MYTLEQYQILNQFEHVYLFVYVKSTKHSPVSRNGVSTSLSLEKIIGNFCMQISVEINHEYAYSAT